MANNIGGFLDGSQYNLDTGQQVPSNVNPNVITPEDMQKQTPLNLPSVPTSSNPDALVSSIQNTPQTLQDYIKQFTPPETALDTTQNTIIQRINDLLPQTGGKTQALAQEQQNQGIPQLKQQLTDINNQILTGNAEYQKLVADYNLKESQLGGNGSVESAGVYNAQLSGLGRYYEAQKAAKAADLGLLAARAQATTGNINTAISLAQSAVDAKYAPIEDELKIREAQLNSIQPLLAKEEKIQAFAQQQYVQAQQQAIQDKKDRDKQVNDILLQAAQFGADGQTLNKIQNAQSIPEAIANAGAYLSADYKQKLKQQDFDNSIKLQQLQLQKDQIEAGKYSVVGTGQFDGDGNEIKAVFNSKTGQFVNLNNGADGKPDLSSVFSVEYPDGSMGGQCGDFAHQLCDFPQFGDTLSAKQSVVNKDGVKKDNWTPQVGDAVIFNYGPAGHIAVVNAVLEDGKVQLSESNFHNDGKVTNDRTVSVNDKNIYGAIHGTLKNGANSGAQSEYTPSVMSYAQQYASTGTIPTGMKSNLFSKVSQAAKELPKPAGTLVDMNTGIKSGKLDSTQTQAITSLFDLQKKLDDAKTLFDSYHHGLLAGLKNKAFPSQTEQQYKGLRSEIVDLLARARTGAAINASEEALYASKLPGDFNKFFFLGSNGDTSILSLKSSLTGKLDSTLKINGLSIYGYSKVKLGDQQYTVGDVVQNKSGQSARINPDGSLTLIQ